MRTLDFIDCTQRRFTNVTVRRGYKWADLKIGDVIPITDKGQDTGKNALIRQITIKPFTDIKGSELKREHDPTCTKRSGLLKAMKRAYPDFLPSEPVVLITYIVKP